MFLVSLQFSMEVLMHENHQLVNEDCQSQIVQIIFVVLE
ncbi:unnamed protein product [Schistosoma mattheei]|uniref:Uncharacterized protein n=1 Tax=Schistosoma mattheei TaxID=31246 RepID=A0A3P8BHF6_9TREM|nr:unnamed protein product [Schistosoma mattheei]